MVELAGRCSSTGYACPQRGGMRKSGGEGEQMAGERLTPPAAPLPSPEWRVSKKQALNLLLVVQFSCVQANKTLMRPLVTAIKVALRNKSNLRTVSPVLWNNL